MASSSIIACETLGEKHKALNLMVKEAVDIDFLLKENLQNLSDKKQIDLIFLARLARYTKNGYAVYQLLKSEDRTVVGTVLNSKWFFTGKTHPDIVNIEFFKNQLFPYVSRHVLCRIISKLGAYLEVETVAEDFYNYFHDLYGCDMGLKLLTKCSPKFVKAEIMKGYLKLPYCILYRIYEKDENNAFQYLEQTKNEGQSIKILQKVADKDVENFYALVKKIKLTSFGFGKNLTKKFMKKYKNEVFNNPEMFPYLKTKIILQMLSAEQIDKFLFLNKPMNHFEREQRGFNYLKKDFQTKMYKKLYTMNYLIPKPDIKYMYFFRDMMDCVTLEERVQWAKDKIENIQPNDREREDYYLKFLSIDEAIPRYQELCKATKNWKERSSYLSSMAECCKINKDEDALLKLCQYVAERHRNDVPDLRHQFLLNVRQSFTIDELSSNHWDVFNEMIEFICVNKETESNYYCYNMIVGYYNGYLSHCLHHGLPFQGHLRKMIRNVNDITSKLSVEDLRVWDVVFENYKQTILQEQHLMNMEECFQNVHKLVEIKNRKCMSPENFSWMVNFIKQNHESDKIADETKSRLFTALRSDKTNKDLFVEEFFMYALDDKLAVEYFKHKPKVFCDQMEHFIKESATNFKPGYRRIIQKINSYLLMNDKMKMILSAFVNQTGSENIEQRAMCNALLCFVMPPAESRKILKDLSPTENNIEQNEDAKKAEVLARYMGTINPPVSYDTLSLYLKGDYLKYSLSSMLRLVHRKPSEETKTFIRGLLDKPLSLKKHFVHLSYTLYPRNELLPFYQSLWTNERNPSIRKKLFAFTYYLLTTENEIEKYNQIWNTLRCFLDTMAVTDKRLFKYLDGSSTVKDHVTGDYFELCWKVLKRMITENADVSCHINNFYFNAHTNIDHLTRELCDVLLIEFLKSIEKSDDQYESSQATSLMNLAVDYLLKSKNNVEIQQTNVTKLCDFYKNYIENNWNRKVDNYFPARNKVTCLIETLCNRSINLKSPLDPSFVHQSFKQMLLSLFNIDAIFLLVVITDLMLIYKNLQNEATFEQFVLNDRKNELTVQFYKNFGYKAAVYANEICSKYGEDVYVAIIKTFNHFESVLYNSIFSYLNMNEKDWLKLYIAEGLLSEEAASNVATFTAISVLPDEINEDDDATKKSLVMLVVEKIMQKNIVCRIALRNKLSCTDDNIIQ